MAVARDSDQHGAGFTLLELLVVIALIVILTVLVRPAFTSLKTAGNVTNSASTVVSVLEQARNHALATNTYVWVGFFEEDQRRTSTIPATAGTGRIVLSSVASKDGTTIYDPNNLGAIDAARLVQLGKLTKIEGAHLATFSDGSGSGQTFDTRPAAQYNTARIGDSTPPNPSQTPFHYPVGSSSATVQYTFTKVVEFSPRGEARINNSNYTYKPVAEIGLRPTHGNIVDTNSQNLVAVQFSAFSGDFKLYRK